MLTPPHGYGDGQPEAGSLHYPHHHQHEAEPPVSKTTQYKKITKPLLERKRRARINACLDELKEIMTGCLQSEGENVSKLEKADILELTVRHIQRLAARGGAAPPSPGEEVARFRAGYSQCASEAAQFLVSLPGVDLRVGQRLVSHLLTAPPPPPPPPAPLPALLQQRMLSSLLSSGSWPPAPDSTFPPSLLFPPAAPSTSSGPGPAVTSIKTEPQVTAISPPAAAPALSKQSDLLKPVPVKPSPLRARPTSTSPKLDVWKPYSS